MVESIIYIVDYVVQGVLVLLVVWYACSGWAKFDERIKTFRTWFAQNIEHLKGPIGTTIALVALGAAYSLGILANSFAYDLFQPAHEQIIHAAETNKRAEEVGSFWMAFFSPFARHRSGDDEAARARSLCTEIAWRNDKREVSQSALEPLTKQLRIHRGAAISSLAFALVSLMRLVIHQKRKLSAGCLVIGIIIYGLSMREWRDIEAQYHMDVRFGARTSSSPGLSECSFHQ